MAARKMSVCTVQNSRKTLVVWDLSSTSKEKRIIRYDVPFVIIELFTYCILNICREFSVLRWREKSFFVLELPDIFG